jgi:phage shock protein A
MPGSFARVVRDSRAKNSVFGRMEENVHHAEAFANAEKAHANEDVAERFERLEKNEEVQRLLANLKERRTLDPWAALLLITGGSACVQQGSAGA